MKDAYNNIELKNFLLGYIKTGKQRRRIEERLMLDDDYFELFEMIEDELIQEYVDDELTASERNDFEMIFFLSEERIEKIKFAFLLRSHINNLKKQKIKIAKK